MKVNKTAVFLILFFVLLSSVFLGYYYYQVMNKPKYIKPKGNPGHMIGPFSFKNQEGNIITEKDIEGKIFVAEFFFTTCKGICPKMNDNLVRVYEAFRSDDDLRLLSHTVDPETDTVEQMKRYSLKYDADPNKWFFLTGDKKKIYDMALNDYLITAADSTVDRNNPVFIHSPYLILIDKSKTIRNYYDGTDSSKVTQLISDIKELEKSYQRN